MQPRSAQRYPHGYKQYKMDSSNHGQASLQLQSENTSSHPKRQQKGISTKPEKTQGQPNQALTISKSKTKATTRQTSFLQASLILVESTQIKQDDSQSRLA
jgi:hypothetical protein